jgi:hypothetical protein
VHTHTHKISTWTEYAPLLKSLISIPLGVYHKHTLILLLWWAHAHKNTTATAVFV